MEGDPTEPLRSLSSMEEIEDRAFRRGEASARLKSLVDSHERRLNAINGSIDRLVTSVGDLGESFRQSIAVAATRADDAAKRAIEAKEESANNLSTRTFVVSLVAAATGVCLVVVGALALFIH